MPNLTDLQLNLIKDSRNEDTLEVKMKSNNLEVSASVPRGKSRGEKEATLLEPKLALERFPQIKSYLLRENFSSLSQFDSFLISLDGTKNKANLGGNLTLVLSQAYARLQAQFQNLSLCQYLRKELVQKVPSLERKLQKTPPPYFFFNLINGGSHAPYGPKIQEYLFIPVTNKTRLSLDLATVFFANLKEYCLVKYGKVEQGDEGGLLVPENNYEQPLEILNYLRQELGLQKEVRFGLDAAASTFYQTTSGKYEILPGHFYSQEELLSLYQSLNSKYHFLSLEDPFSETDWSGFQLITKRLKRQTEIIGDDLTATNPELLTLAYQKEALSGVIIKPTQIGTITETLNTIALAHQLQIKIIVSHRSGETLDDFIADLAIATGAWGFKAGAPQPQERMIKYQRVVELTAN
ncbi:MAG: Phosphopyruvate hydratase [Patescibacteria group bacterium]|nr:Phosphopyruvate hydratase [Patescibacteria group bacterium]